MSNLKRNRQGQLKRLLEERRQKIWNELRNEVFEKLGGEYRSEFEKAMDLGDLSIVDELQSVGINLVNIRQEELAQINEAERKLEDGTYGICELCGREIAEERLTAMPFAIHCVKCEKELEKGHLSEEPRRLNPEE
jgi:DnaK suppressor protein